MSLKPNQMWHLRLRHRVRCRISCRARLLHRMWMLGVGSRLPRLRWLLAMSLTTLCEKRLILVISMLQILRNCTISLMWHLRLRQEPQCLMTYRVRLLCVMWVLGVSDTWAPLYLAMNQLLITLYRARYHLFRGCGWRPILCRVIFLGQLWWWRRGSATLEIIFSVPSRSIPFEYTKRCRDAKWGSSLQTRGSWIRSEALRRSSTKYLCFDQLPTAETFRNASFHPIHSPFHPIPQNKLHVMAPQLQHGEYKVVLQAALVNGRSWAENIWLENESAKLGENMLLFYHSLFVITVLSFFPHSYFPLPALALISVERGTVARNCKVQLGNWLYVLHYSHRVLMAVIQPSQLYICCMSAMGYRFPWP